MDSDRFTRPWRRTRSTGRGATFALVAAMGLASLFVATGGMASDSGQTRLLVKFAPGASASARVMSLASVGATDRSTIAGINVHVVTVGSTQASTALARLKANPSVQFAEPDATADATEVPNDPSFSLEWGMNKIKAPDAWTTTHGSSGTVVAILDTGISLSHPDLSGKIVASQNFSSSSTVDDVDGHGSHVAGIAASATNNAVGVAGLGYNDRLLNVKVLGDGGSGTYANVASGITWAADNGADVINLSLTGTAPSSTLESAVDYAWSKGVVVVAAAGNSANSTPTYPASYANAIAVAATTDLDKLAPFSDYGDWVDVAAPGNNIYSTIPGGYGYKSGTSMASPYVAGLAGLLFATQTDANGNGRLNDEVRAQLQATADDIGLTGIGSGRINASRAVGAAAPPAAPPANTSLPAISGSAAVSKPLTASTGGWTNSPTSFAYQWQRCDAAGANCAAISGATLSTYTVASADAGSTMRARVTATNLAGSGQATSAQTSIVVSAPPANTALPAITGTPKDGQTLQSSTGTWTNSPASFAYQWLRCDAAGSNCASISGATASSYTLASADVGSTVRAQVTATNAAGSTTAKSAQTTLVTALAPTNTSLPTVSGSAKPGQTLTASSGSWSGTTPMTYAGQWLRCDPAGANCAAISGATGSNYTVASADLGSTIRAQVTATNAAGSASATSPQTGLVSNLQTLTFTGTLTKNTTTLAFPLTIGAGEADATLTFSRSATMTLALVNAAKTVVGQATWTASPLELDLPSLAAGPYTYVVAGSGFKGSVSFTLTVKAPSL